MTEIDRSGFTRRQGGVPTCNASHWHAAAILPNFSRPFCPIIGPEQRTPDFHRNPRNDPLGLGFPMLPHQKPPEMTIFLRQRPWRPMLSRASMILCIAAVAALGGGRAAAQNCFLFFCPPGAQPPWQTTPAPDRQTEPSRPLFNGDFQYSTIYAQRESEPFPVPALRMSQIDPTYLRKSVYYATDEPPGTIVIDPQQRFLYLVEGGGRAIRYGVGVGRSGFEWSGVATVHNKQEWPDWYPPKEMIDRQPELRKVM